jgi:predicted HicB family RNase H-like nuclease
MKTSKEPAKRIGRPPTGQTPKRIFRMDDEGWQAVEAAARAAGVTTSEWVREVLSRAAKRAKTN